MAFQPPPTLESAGTGSACDNCSSTDGSRPASVWPFSAVQLPFRWQQRGQAHSERLAAKVPSETQREGENSVKTFHPVPQLQLQGLSC